jgi:hypothetical protein
MSEPFLKNLDGSLYRPRERVANFKSARDFCAEFRPPDYAIEPFVRSASLYTLTAKTGSGKTALAIVMALAIATGRPDILDRDVAHGRVAYVAAENPDDLRMRVMVAAYQLNIDLDELGDRLMILDYRVKPEELAKRLKGLAESRPFSLIIIDTLAAFFDGNDANDNVQGGEFMRRLRPLTQIGGSPSIIVAAHPVKNASEDNLVPYGGGAILNEVDGNLTLSSKSGLVSLHWQGKFRGLEFKPLFFRMETVSSPDVVDAKGRQVLLPVCRPSTEEASEDRQATETRTDLLLIRAMIENPTGTQQDWGRAIGRAKSNVCVRLQRLKGEKLVEVAVGKWSVTAKGRKIAA